jgi:hypothetical protein
MVLARYYTKSEKIKKALKYTFLKY